MIDQDIMHHSQYDQPDNPLRPSSFVFHPPLDFFLLIAVALVALLLGGLSVARYEGYNAGMLDLGNMAQAIGSVRRGQPLVSTFPDGATSRLALHVELIYYLFAPLYALWPDPRTLLIAQALLFALGAFPVYAIARRGTDSRFVARCLTLVYLLYPTAQTSVLFDFHGDTLAMPILLFALDALDRRAWKSYALWIALALSCKFYVALPVALVGVLLWRNGERRVGLVTLVAGLMYGALAFFVIRPLFTTGQTSTAQRGLSYASFYFGQFGSLWSTLNDRLLSAVVVFGPALLLSWRGRRWLLPSLPIAAAALLSSGPGGSFDYRYHHYATVVPFIMMAAIEGVQVIKQKAEGRRQKAEGREPQGSEPQGRGQGASRASPPWLPKKPAESRARHTRSWRGDTGLTLAIVVIFSVLLVDTPLNPLFWLGIPGQGRDSAAYGITVRDGMKDRFLVEFVPPRVPLAASTFLAPHLADRDTLYLLRYPDEQEAERLPSILPKVDAALADALFDWRVPLDNGFGGGVDYDRSAIKLLLQDPSFSLVAERDGLLFFERGAPPNSALVQRIETLPPAPTAPVEHRFGDGPELVAHQIELVPAPSVAVPSERRLRASFTWRTNHSLDKTSLLAVSRLDAVSNARIVHLPSYALLRPDQWQPGQLVRETFEVGLPSELPPGRYTWYVGWYNARSPEAASTDARSRLGDEESLGVIEVP